MVEVTVCGCGQLQGTEVDIVESLVINTVYFICVLSKLVDRQCSVVGFYNCVGHLQQTTAVFPHTMHKILFANRATYVYYSPDLYEQRIHTTMGMCQLEYLKTVTALSLLAEDIENGVYQFGTLGNPWPSCYRHRSVRRRSCLA